MSKKQAKQASVVISVGESQMSKRFDYVDHHGNLVGKFSCSFTAAAERTLHSIGIRSYMRMGHFSVMIGDGVCVVARIYETLQQDKSITRTSEFWEQHKRDRLSQIRRVRAALRETQHPMEKAVLADIRVEEKELA